MHATCVELKIVKSQAKGAELALTARMPKTQVRPRSGRRASDPMKTDLGILGGKKFQSINEFIIYYCNEYHFYVWM